MKAPLYPPATAFVLPKRLPGILSTKDTPIADLKLNPAAWAIVMKEMPNIDQRIGNPMLKPHLGNFSFQSLLPFGVVQQDVLDKIDVQFKALGAVR